MEQAFYLRVNEFVQSMDVKKRNKYLMKAELYNEVVQILKASETKHQAQLKFWAKKNFNLVRIGEQDILYSLKEKLPVVTSEDLFEKIKECHTAVGHFGRDKTWREVTRRYSYIPMKTVIFFIELCDQCVSRKIFPKLISGKPIISDGLMTRMQIDLVDMRSVEHNGFKWIFHAKDHFSKYSWLYPLTSKEAINVAEVLKTIFYQFGTPRILQSDNGREFVAKVIINLKQLWPGLLIINGRPRHPQSQGLVERGNAVVQQLLGKWLDTNATTDWPSGLGPVMFAINTSVARTIDETPFEVVFGQQPRIDHAWKCIQAQLKNKQSNDANETDENNQVIFEEDLPDDIFEMIKLTTEAEEPQVNDKKDDTTDEPATNIMSIGSDIVDYQAENNEKVPLDCNIDHEEFVDVAGSASNVVVPEADAINTCRHKRIRKDAEEKYFDNANAQLTRYISRSCKRQRNYVIDDIVGLKVSDVDRTNTSSTILPCKIIGLKDQDAETLYNVATMNGIIQESFRSTTFLDLTSSNFAILRGLNTDSLSTVSFIQAYQLYTNFRSADT